MCSRAHIRLYDHSGPPYCEYSTAGVCDRLPNVAMGDRLDCPQPVEVHKSAPPVVIVVVPRTEMPAQAKAALALAAVHCVYDLRCLEIARRECNVKGLSTVRYLQRNAH